MIMFVQIREFPDYLVDENGTVVSLSGSNQYGRFPRWKEIKSHKINSGYLVVDLYCNNIRKTKLVHRLVMEAFCGSSDLEVNHKDTDKTNNQLPNLEYVTSQDNKRHAWASGLYEKTRISSSINGKRNIGEKCGTAKLSDTEAAQLLTLKGSMLQRECAALFGISREHVRDIWNGKKRKHLNKEVI